MYVCRELTDFSYPAIAREFGGRATLFSNGAVFRSFLNIESYAIAAKAGDAKR